jgi:hypothetical protein
VKRMMVKRMMVKRRIKPKAKIAIKSLAPAQLKETIKTLANSAPAKSLASGTNEKSKPKNPSGDHL